MTNLVFFGAGASKPFGIPTMQGMVIEFEKTLEDNDPDLFKFYSEIKETLIKEYGDSKIDIESMLSVISGIAANTKPAELGHFVFYYFSDDCSHKEFSSDEIELGKNLQEKLQSYIKKTCKINISQNGVNEAYARSYLPLFKHMGGSKQRYEEVDLSNDWKAYTTNYDNIFEDFWSAYRLPEDHFKQIDNSDNYSFNINPLQDKQTFCKLHGSLDWTQQMETHRIIRKTRSGYERFKTKDSIMLFPIQQKDLYLHPWFTLFQDLKLGLLQKKTLYVIGYAFNDEFIRNAFQESLVSGSKKKLVIINPEAEQIKDKFDESIKSHIDILPIKFGDEVFELQFEDYVTKVKTIVLRFLIKRDLFGSEDNQITIKCNHDIQSAKILNDSGVKVIDSNTSNGTISDGNKQHVFFTIQNPKDVEIKLELKIDHTYDDEIKLYISDNTEELNVGIDYGGEIIARSEYVKEDYGIKDGIVWMSHPIKLDKTKLYR